MASMSNLDLVNACDVFPYPSDAAALTSRLSGLYTLLWEDTPIGYVPEFVFNALAKVPISIKGEMEVNRNKRTLTCFTQPTERERSAAVAATTAYWRKNKTFEVLAGWRDELYPIYGPGNELLYSIERCAATLFGVMTYGVHMMAYTTSSSPYANSSHKIKLWVPRRSATKSTFPSMLDNTVAGGISTGEDPLEAVIREADEEASLPSSLVRPKIKSHGTITYTYIRPEGKSEAGCIQPECQYVYDIELAEETVCKPNDSEVEGFERMTVEHVQEAMRNGEFKPNCALLMLDFFIRHGIITKESEKDYGEIFRRLHRDLDFPGPHKQL